MSHFDPAGFARYVPGFNFLQNLGGQVAAGSPAGAGSGSGLPPLGQWVAPTFDVDELDKRIQELKAVHFWLDQNAKALTATIQALEVQKMTLATLQGMNVSFNDVAEAFKIRPGAAPVATVPPAAAQASVSAEEQAAADAAPEAPKVDPMHWWNALTQQFQSIAGNTLKDMAAAAAQAPLAEAPSGSPAKAARSRTPAAKAKPKRPSRAQPSAATQRASSARKKG